ncbi:undecaprenyl-phosphate glucose phosphotransferase [Mucilaginibacter sp.]|uniref:undecaprenyl-phosphate glucose phosphotransferase n=1 Tax=Mucilaginibacter sp. TaxID=1882438 RepID=UPI0025EACAB6|nr:undecaprenyl-phosphate glucose phosphotransferase [Mucilaginibacter sp.]
MEQTRTNLIRSLNPLVDYLLLNFSLIIVYNLFHTGYLNWAGDKSYVHVILIFNLVWLLATNIIRLYSITAFGYIYKKSFKAYFLYVFLVSYIVMYLNNIASYNTNSQYLLASMCLYGVLLGLWKISLVKTVAHLNVFRQPLRTAIIVGGSRTGIELYNRFKNDSSLGYQILGIFHDSPLEETLKELHLGHIADCINFSRKNSVAEIFCTLPFSQKHIIEKLIKESDKNMIRFKLVPEHYAFLQGTLLEQSLNRTNAYAIRVEPLENLVNRLVKRVFDIAFSLFVIIFILSWLYPIIYLLIKLESEGAAIFVQPRSGRDNVPFNCYKFRSMRINNDANSSQATKGDARVTKIGAFLRKSSLDEMPQFFNVLIGNMSVVGPRPHMLNHTEQYSNLIDQFMVRHFIKPGITGWAQINGHRGETKLVEDMKARVEADVWYMENWRFNLDIKIIFSTFLKTIGGDKYAY